MAIGSILLAVVSFLSVSVGKTYDFLKDAFSTMIALMPKPLKIILFLFVVLFVGGTLSNFAFNWVTDYQCDVINDTTYVYGITNPDALDVWHKSYFMKLHSQDRLGELGLNESEIDLIIGEYNVGETTAIYGIKYIINKLWGWFEEDNPDFNIYCYELYDVLTISERADLGLHPSCGLDDIPEPEDIIPLITEYIDNGDDVFFYPICVSDDKGGYYPKLSFLGFDVFDFWTWFILLVVSIGVTGYYRWSDMLGLNH